MRQLAAALVIVIVLTSSVASASGAHRPVPKANLRPVVELAQRVVPWLAPNLVLEAIPLSAEHDVFELSSRNDKIVIRASSPSAAAAGLNWYLKYFCHRSISHLGDNIAPVAPLPRMTEPVRKVARFEQRYYLNFCTFNYTFSFYDWNRWQRELDWMALNGINLALATNGFEAVWQNTLRRMNFSEREILDFIPGPGYQAWWLMGNLEGWGGPVTQRMIDERAELEKRILVRMKELGIQPVMQGFYGMVPAALAKKYPAAKIVEQGEWNGFRRPRILLSSDPLFGKMAAIYYEQLAKLYGPARYFGGDLFHEGGITEGLDVPALARNVQDAMQRSNPGAIWVLQGWQENPRDDLLSGLRRNEILVLSLEADWEKRKGFGGSPWIWGVLNNFGDNVSLAGDLWSVAADPAKAAASPYGRNLRGVGALMEGVTNNPALYELVFDSTWLDSPIDVHQWASGYATARYGQTTPEVERAWQLLTDTVYRTHWFGRRSAFCSRPPLEVTGASKWGAANYGYDAAKLEEAARELLSARDRLRNVETYQVDVVDVVRQVLANRGRAAYRRMLAALDLKDKARFQKEAEVFTTLLKQQDDLLGTRKEFMLGPWLAQAKAQARGESEAGLFERNARTQITYWGPDDPKTDLHDYAYKEWSGLLRDFYLPRWEMFIREMDARFDGGVAKDPDYFSFERHWAQQRNAFPVTPKGDPIDVAVKAFLEPAVNP